MLLTDPGIFIFITNYLKNRFHTRNSSLWTRTGKTPFKADSSLFIIVCPFGMGNTMRTYYHTIEKQKKQAVRRLDDLY